MNSQNATNPSNKNGQKNNDVEQKLLQVPDTKKNNQLFASDLHNASAMTEIEEKKWKPALHHSYETMALSSSELNYNIRPSGFRSSGKMRKIKKTCLLSKLKTRNRIRSKNLKLAVCITMYNEKEDELKETLTGVIYNYNELRNDENINFKKDDMVVFLICDGYERISDSFKKFAKEKQFFDEQKLIDYGFLEQDRDKKWKMKDMRDIMDPKVEPPTNIVHMFQVSTWDFGLEQDVLKARRINFIFAIKQRNDGKINSHKWFFQGLCKYLKPEHCLMLDIGTRPDRHAVYKLYKYMQSHPYCGGCCGEIEVDFSTEKGISSSYFIKAAQFYEYKMGHTPDKACESFFGFNSVLPGAYSVFRWKAIKGEPLEQFFKSVTRKDLPSCQEANEYLAEDRVMCLQIYIKKNQRYTLTYVPEAKAFTDAPDSLSVLIKQRRRWMNGAMFGTIKVISHLPSVLSCGRTKHPWYKQLLMFLFMIYYVATFLFQFFAMGSMYASISIFLKQEFANLLATSTAYDQGFLNWLFNEGGVADIFDYIYIALILMCVIISLSTPVDRAVPLFIFLMVFFGFLLLSSMIGIAYYLAQTGLKGPNPDCLAKCAEDYCGPDFNNNCLNQSYIDCKGTCGNSTFQVLVFAGIIMTSVFIVPMLLRPIDFLKNFMNYICGLVAYLFMMPTFINVFQIYAMCNLHDISWGNRPTQGQGTEAVAFKEQDKQKLDQDYKVFRAYFLYMWLVLNVVYAVLMTSIVDSTYSLGSSSVQFLNDFALFVASLVAFKVVFATIYQLKWYLRFCCNSDYQKNKVDIDDAFKKIRKQKYTGEESSDEEDEQQFLETEKTQAQVDDDQDEDDDDKEFEAADPEEEEDKQEEELRKTGKSRSTSNFMPLRNTYARNQKNALIESIDSVYHEDIILKMKNQHQPQPQQTTTSPLTTKKSVKFGVSDQIIGQPIQSRNISLLADQINKNEFDLELNKV